MMMKAVRDFGLLFCGESEGFPKSIENRPFFLNPLSVSGTMMEDEEGGDNMPGQDWIQKLEAMAGSRFRTAEPMKLHTSFRIGGPADYWFSPASADEILYARELADSAGVPVTILGNGTNLLVSDLGIEGLVIQIGEPFSCIEVHGIRLKACAGAALSKVCQTAQAAGLTGLEFAYGIPGNVGGAVTMNAGAYGGEVGQKIVSVKILDPSGGFLTVPGSDMGFAYRHSCVSDRNWIVLEASFELEADDPRKIRIEMDDIFGRRRDKQPLNYPSAGSVFKRPDGYFAGKLIEDAGLKGARIGDAQVSEKHAGFIVNLGNATSADVESLIGRIRETVLESFGVELEPELRRIGRNA